MQRKPYEEYHPDTYAEFNRIATVAKSLGSSLETPEFVLVGPSGVGKTTLLNSILGHGLFTGRSKRPLEVRIVCRPNCATPKVTILRDSHLKEYDSDMPVALDRLDAELAKRNVATSLPIYLTYEYANLMNMTIIDLPGVTVTTASSEKSSSQSSRKKSAVGAEESAAPDEGSDDGSTDNSSSFVAGNSSGVAPPQVKPVASASGKLAKLTPQMIAVLHQRSRVIVCVDKALADSGIVEVIQQINPGFSRTVFVDSFLHETIETFQSGRDANQYLSGRGPGVRTFAVSLPVANPGNFSTGAAFRASVEKLVKDDLTKLEALQYDRMLENSIGVLGLRAHLIELTWVMYRDMLPKLQESMSTHKKERYEELHRTRMQLSGLESFRLRSTAMTCAMNYLKEVERLVKDGAGATVGWNLEEELDGDIGFGPWLDDCYQPLSVEAEAWDIEGASSRLTGRPQFERLLVQFRTLADHTPFGTAGLDQVACAADTSSLNTAPQIAGVACDLAMQRVRRSVQPLARQLHIRAVETLLHVLDVSGKIDSSGGMNGAGASRIQRNMTGAELSMLGTGSQSAANIHDFPYYLHRVRDIYTKFVQDAAETCVAKCFDDMRCTRHVPWDLVQFGSFKLPSDKELDGRMTLEQRKEQCIELARLVYTDVRTRLAENIVLKYHNYLLMPTQMDIWGAVQSQFTSLTDEEIAKLFEMEANRATLQGRESALDASFKSITEMEMAFMMSSTNFSHPR